MAARRRARERDATRGGGVSEDGSETSDPFAFIGFITSADDFSSFRPAHSGIASRGVTTAVHLPGVGKGLRDVAAVGLVAQTAHTTLDKVRLSTSPGPSHLK